MNTELKTLDRAVQASVALELGEEHDERIFAELGIAPKRTRLIAGVEVVSNASRDARVHEESAKMVERLLRYSADRQLVVSKLKRVGVEPIAVLPVTAWEYICNKFGLYRFAPDGDVVLCDDRIIKEENKRVQNALSLKVFGIVPGLIMSFMIGPIIMIVGQATPSDLLLVQIGKIIEVSGVLLFFGSVILTKSVTMSRKTIESIRKKVVEHEENSTLVKELWPEFVEPNEGVVIHIAFPEPPAKVQERLVAVERTRLPLHFAVVPEAIMFKESVADAFINAGNRTWTKVKVNGQIQLNRDPIAYVVEGTAVAIIDQYGQFPIEIEVMREVINSDHLV